MRDEQKARKTGRVAGQAMRRRAAAVAEQAAAVPAARLARGYRSLRRARAKQKL